jgi:hypothetical protein
MSDSAAIKISKTQELLAQIAAFADVNPARPPFDFEESGLLKWMNASRLRQEGRRQVWVKNRPSTTLFVRYVFQSLGLKTEPAELDAFLDAEARSLAADTEGLPFDQQDAFIGTSVPPDSLINQALRGLDSAVSDFHGNLYDAELQQARLLSHYIVELALTRMPEDLPHASNM